MQTIRRLLVRFFAWLVPDIQRALDNEKKFRDSLVDLQKRFVESLRIIREDAAGYSAEGVRAYLADQDANQRAAEVYEAQMMFGSGPQAYAVVLKEADQVRLKERLWELELALEDRGWKRQLAIAATEFSRYGLQQIILIARLYFIKNPLVKAGVKTASSYVFGRGIEITTDDDAANEVWNDFYQENISELGQRGLVEKEHSLHTDGNVFFAFFRRPTTGAIKLRTIDACEVSDVICNPDDAQEPWFYKRDYSEQVFNPTVETISQNPQKTVYYPALGWNPEGTAYASKPKTLGSTKHEIAWETPVVHMRVGGMPKWKFGVPDVYASIDWARTYQNFLYDWATISRALARFAWNVETLGGPQAIEAFNQALSTTLGDGGGVNIETNPPPVTAAAFVSGPGNKLTPVKTAGATTNPENSRRIMLMVAAAFGLPETFFGDASTGSLATAQSLDRPTELKFLERQEHWRETLQKIVRYILESSVSAPKGRLREALRQRKVNLREFRVLFATGQPGKFAVLTRVREATPAAKTTATVTIKFPAVLEHDITSMVSAIATAATLNGYTPADTIDIKTVALMVLAELGAEDPQAIVDAMYPPESYDPEVVEEPEPAPAASPSAPPPGAGSTPAPAREGVTLTAIVQLQRLVERLLNERRTGSGLDEAVVAVNALRQETRSLLKAQEGSQERLSEIATNLKRRHKTLKVNRDTDGHITTVEEQVNNGE